MAGGGARSRSELVSRIRTWEMSLRALGSRWPSSIPGDVRKELLDAANGMLRVLERESPGRGKGPPLSRIGRGFWASEADPARTRAPGRLPTNDCDG
jgi:hypothetical protein